MKQLPWSAEPTNRGFFTTIEDVIRLSQDLCDHLCKFAEYKYPLAVRRGVSMMTKSEDSRSVRAGSITYFFDIKKTRENKPFLVITESRFKGEGKDHERKAIIVFQENIEEFTNALSEMAAKIQ